MTFDAVILAAGDFPRKGTKAWELLETSRRVVACDGAVNAYVRRFGSYPCAVVGDMDSVRHPRQIAEGCRFVKIDEQDTNDLEKAVSFCRDSGWRRIAVVGATGRREDHTLGNLSLLADYAQQADSVCAVTNYGVFFTAAKSGDFPSIPGQQISIIALQGGTEVTSSGLKYPMEKLKLTRWWQATLNEAAGDSFHLDFTPGSELLIFQEHPDKK